MAGARKCDRCGMCFDPLSEDLEMARFQNPIFQTADNIRNTTVGRRLITGKGSADIYVDLCPTCTSMFAHFMNGEGFGSNDDWQDILNVQLRQFKSQLLTELMECEAERIKEIVVEATATALCTPIPKNGKEEEED